MSEENHNKKIRAGYSKGRFYIDNKVIDENYVAKLGERFNIYVVLARRANSETQGCYPSCETLMRESGIKNRNRVFSTIELLEKVNMIKIVRSRGKTSNRYWLIDQSEWKPADIIPPDTVATVSKSGRKQYQKTLFNSITSDTRNEQIKLTKEMRNSAHKKVKEMRDGLVDKWRIN